jgi:hypothetical protein
MNCQNASVPEHLYGYVCREFLYGMDRSYKGEYEPCIIIGITAIPSRCFHFSILLESGAKWARVPIHMLRHEKPDREARPITDLQVWDCMGWDFSVIRYDYLREMACTYRTTHNEMIDAQYWFTLDFTENGFSMYPPEHKDFNFLLLEDGTGQIAAMPNNRILWKDHSFVKPGHKFDYKVVSDTKWYSEISHVNPQDTAFTQDQ